MSKPRLATLLAGVGVSAPALGALLAVVAPAHQPVKDDALMLIWFVLCPAGLISAAIALVLGVKQKRWGLVALAGLSVPLVAGTALLSFALGMSGFSY